MVCRYCQVVMLSLVVVMRLFYGGDAYASDNKQLMDGLVKSYPDCIVGHDDKFIIWKDGTRMLFDDGVRGRSFLNVLELPTLRDIICIPYYVGPQSNAPECDCDPGRVRYEPFFNKMYGDCGKGEAQSRLVSIKWLPKKWGGKISITSVNGVAEKLSKVSAELDRLPAKYDKYLIPVGGAYNCRRIDGSLRKSPHGYGIAIDISPRYSNYWRWSKRGLNQGYYYENRVPYEIVEIFERYGFIWGGKWFHFDTMHFEYRPELIYFNKKVW